MSHPPAELPRDGEVTTTFPVGEYLEEELRERGWDRDDLALQMGGDFGQQRLIVDMILELSDDPNILLDDDTAAALGLALGTSAALWKRLHETHRAALLAARLSPPREGATKPKDPCATCGKEHWRHGLHGPETCDAFAREGAGTTQREEYPRCKKCGGVEHSDVADCLRGVDLIAAERARQVEQEGWSPAHDDEHADESLAVVAACYALPDDARGERRIHDPDPQARCDLAVVPEHWPDSWDFVWWRPTPGNRIRELVKAGALIAAEIDRLQRAATPTPSEEQTA